MAEQSESIKKAVVTLRELSEDEKIRQQCEARERYQMDWQSSMRTSRETGREEGRREGREEGRKEGSNEGRAQEAKRISALTARLLKEKRLEDLQRTTEDEKYREKLLKEYGLE